MSLTDPLDALAVGVAADHTAKKSRAKKDKAPAAQVGDEAAQEAIAAGSPSDEAEALGTVVEEKAAEAVEAAADELAPPVPDSPGDDRESVFERRVTRLTTLVEEAEFDSGTAYGDLRDMVVDLYKHRPQQWAAMNQGEQRDLVRHIEGVAKQILGKVILVLAQEDMDTIQGTLLGQFSVKGETIEAKLKIESADSDVLQTVFAMAGHRIVIISADDKRFMSSRREVATLPDQMPLAFADPAPKPDTPPPAPAGDTDLNPDDDDGDPIGDIIAAGREATGKTHGIYDSSTSEWLAEEREGEEVDIWTDQASDAKAFTKADAEGYVAQVGAPMEALPLDGG